MVLHGRKRSHSSFNRFHYQRLSFRALPITVTAAVWQAIEYHREPDDH